MTSIRVIREGSLPCPVPSGPLRDFRLFALAVSTGWRRRGGSRQRAVLELFTSQGCSSCPPADRLLGAYVDQKDVVALSFPVDYWDYLGWKDTLASPDNTERQRDYAAARGDRKVYTPQVVVDGRPHAVGSDRSAIEAAIADARACSVPSSCRRRRHHHVDSAAGSRRIAPHHAAVWLVVFDRAITVKIGRGENSDRTVTYNNVVRKMNRVAMWKGKAMSVDLPRSEMVQSKPDRCAVLVQAETVTACPGACSAPRCCDVGKQREARPAPPHAVPAPAR